MRLFIYYSIYNNRPMQKKKNHCAILPKMNHKTSHPSSSQQFSDSLIYSKSEYQDLIADMKQNIDLSQQTIFNLKAKNYLKKTKKFDSPQMIFALNDAIREQVKNLKENEFRGRVKPFENNTFHCSKNGSFVAKQKLSCHDVRKNSLRKKKMLKETSSSFKVEMPQNKSSHFPEAINFVEPYAISQERIKAKQLKTWIRNKIQQLVSDPTKISLQSILDYNQTVLNYGLGQAIDSVSKRCKQEGETLKFVWDNTFKLFQNIINILTKQMKLKEVESDESQKYLGQVFQENLAYLKKCNYELEQQNTSLYEKMKRVILWNRNLKKQRNKLDIQLKILEYRLSTYNSALEEATTMLLVYGTEPDCSSLAKKIISKLHRQKIHKKRRSLQVNSQNYVNEQTKQFVRKWLKNYSFLDNDKIEEAVTLTNQEKLELMMRKDQDQRDKIDIFDYFQTYCRGTQTDNDTDDVGIQYEYRKDSQKYVNRGIGTKQVYTMNIGIQSILEDPQQKIKQKFHKKRQSGINKGLKNSKLKRSSKVRLHQSPRHQELLNNLQQSYLKKESRQSFIRKSFSELYSQQNMQKSLMSDIETGKQSICKNKEILQEEEDDWPVPDRKNQSTKIIEEMINQSKQFISSNFIQFTQNFNMQPKLTRAHSSKNYKDNLISESILRSQRNLYQQKPLISKKFQETYQLQMKEQMLNNKEEIIRGVVRKRSFYNKINRIQNSLENQRIMSLYKFTRDKIYGKFANRALFNQIDSEILQYLSSLHKVNPTPANITRLKAYAQSLNIISNLSSATLNNNKPIPKSKQFVTLTVTSITKVISQLLYDLLRKIKADRQNIFIDSQKVYYPLANILVEKMNNKYGLKDIAEKKIKDFVEKMSTFSKINERIGLFYRLLGNCGEQKEKIGSDELLIYMKCIVYFDINKTVTAVSFNKDFSIDRASTNKQTILQESSQLIKEFFPQRLYSQITQKLHKYFQTHKLPIQFQIQKVAQLLIEEFVRQKMLVYENYSKIYKKCQPQFYMNLYKMLEILMIPQIKSQESREYQALKVKYKHFFNECYKCSDVLDEVNGKSLTEQKFISLCFKYQFPKANIIQEIINQLIRQFDQSLKLGHSENSSKQRVQILKKMANFNKIREVLPPLANNSVTQNQIKDPNFSWKTAKIIYEMIEINSNELLGTLGLIKKGYHELANKKNILFN